MKTTFIGLCLLSFALSGANAQSTTNTNKMSPNKVPPTTTAPKQTTPTKTTTNTTTSKPTTTQTAPEKTEVNAPAVVKTKFSAAYPAVKEAKWSTNKAGNYIATFKENGKAMRVVYKADGSLIRTWKQIDESALPQTAKDYLSKNYAGQKITEAGTLQGANNGPITYEVKIGDKKLKFDSKGNWEGGEKPNTKPTSKPEVKPAPKTISK